MKLLQVPRCAVGQSVIGLIPNIFSRVKFWCIRWKIFYMKSWMFKEPLLDFFTSVDCSPIPQKDHWPSNVPEQVFEEGSNIQASEITSAKLDIEGDVSSFRRYHQGIDGRNSVLLVEIVQEGRLPFRCPGAGDVGNKQKARFIQKDQMGPKLFGLFLYGASGNASNGQSVFRFFATPGAPVSGSSNPGLPGVSRRGRDDTQRQTVSRSPRLLAGASTYPSDNQRRGVPSEAALPVCASGTGRAWVDVQAWAGARDLECPWHGTPDAIGTLNSQKHLTRVRRPTASCPLLAAGLLVGDASPADVRFLGVSCPII